MIPGIVAGGMRRTGGGEPLSAGWNSEWWAIDINDSPLEYFYQDYIYGSYGEGAAVAVTRYLTKRTEDGILTESVIDTRTAPPIVESFGDGDYTVTLLNASLGQWVFGAYGTENIRILGEKDLTTSAPIPVLEIVYDPYYHEEYSSGWWYQTYITTP